MGGSCSSLSPAGCRLVSHEEVERGIDELIGDRKPLGGYLTRRQRMLFHDPEAYERRRERVLSTPLPGGESLLELKPTRFDRICLVLYSIRDRFYRK